MQMQISHHNPEGMHRNPAFSQAVTISGMAKLVYVGGQNGVDASGAVVGDDLASQTEQALRNVLSVLAAVGATQENVVKLNIHIVQGQDVRAGFGAAQKVWGQHATAITVLMVSALGVPGALVEIDAVAAVEDSAV
jgi:enamine deaminase RidA (YjgF/YER057c/UK114 family)